MPGNNNNNNNNGQGNPMNGGYNGGNNPNDILSTITQTLDRTLGSVERQLQNISTQLTTLNGQTTQANRNNQNFIRNFTGNRRSRGMAYQERTLNNLYSELKKLRNDSKVSTIGNGSGKGIDGAIASGFNKIQKKYQESLNKIQQNIQTDTNIPQLQQLIARTAQGLERVRQQKAQAEHSGNTTEAHRLEQIVQSRENALTQQQQNLDSQMARYTQQMEDAYEENSRAVQALQQSYEALNEVNSKLSGAYSDLSSISPAFANFIENQDKLSKKDQYKEAVNKALELLSESMDQINKKIEELEQAGGDENAEQIEILKKQLKNAEEQENYLKNLKPIKDNTRQMWSSLKDVGGAVIKGALTGLKNSLENRYLDTYAEGFQRVYDSVESTRNEISARLRFNQGQFDDMQNSIQDEIKAQGLEGAISLVDVNEAVQGLVAAGITDKDTIEKLAFEQAKLKYLGSPFDLQNEGNLSYIMSEINKGTSIDTIVQSFEDLTATTRALGDEYKNSMVFANGGAQAIMTQVSSMGKAAGKSYEQITQDMKDAMTASASLASYNISSDLLTSMLKEIQEQNISSTSPFNQYLLQQGLSADTMRYLSVGEQQDKLVAALKEATDQGGEEPDWLKPLMDTWGISAQWTDMANFLQGANSEKGIKTSNTIEQQKKIEEIAEKDRQAMKDASYKSQTEKVNTEYENTMTDLAQNAEHFFEGDTIFMSQINNIKNGIDSIIDILATFAWSSIAGGARGLFGGLGGGAGGAGGVVGNFLTGKQGTTAGTLGKGAGVALGTFEMGKSLYDNVQRTEEGYILWEQTMNEFASDPDTWKGLGTTIGSAVGGPVAGVIVGELWGAGAKLGNEWSKSWKTRDELEQEQEQSLINEYKLAAEKQLEAAEKNLSSAEEYKQSISSMSEGQKKYELVSKYGIDYESIKGLSGEELDNKLVELAENDRKVAEATEKTAEIIAKTSTSEGLISSAEDKYSKAQLDYKQTKQGSAQRRTAEMKLQNTKALSQIDLSSEEWTTPQKVEGLGIYRSKAEQYMYDIMGEGGQNYYSLLSDVETIKTANPEMSDMEALKAMFPNTSDENLETLMYGLSLQQERKNNYNAANEAFHNRWEIAKSLAGDSNDPYDIYNTYRNLDSSNLPDDGFSKNPENLPNHVLDWYWDPSRNIPNLPDGSGKTGVPTYYSQGYEGKFRSGLSRVPTDNYTAVLHEGERVLTKREAEVYNNIIPDIVEAATTEQYFRTDRSSSNVMNTNVYGSSDSGLHKDITDQTSSLTDVLNKILEALRSIMITSSVKSGINRNILAMNSDVVQVNTSR